MSSKQESKETEIKSEDIIADSTNGNQTLDVRNVLKFQVFSNCLLS